MKAFLTILIGSLSSLSHSQDNPVIEKWKQAEESIYRTHKISANEINELGESMKSEIDTWDDYDRVEFRINHLIDYNVALAWAYEKKYNDAAGALKKEFQYQLSEGRKMTENTRDADRFAPELFALHATIAGNTGKNIHIPELNYKIFSIQGSKKPQFVFTYQIERIVDGDYTVEGMADGDIRQPVFLYSAGQSDAFNLTDKIQAIGNPDKVSFQILERNGKSYLKFSGVRLITDHGNPANFPETMAAQESTMISIIGDGGLSKFLTAQEFEELMQSTNESNIETSGDPSKTNPSVGSISDAHERDKILRIAGTIGLCLLILIAIIIYSRRNYHK